MLVHFKSPHEAPLSRPSSSTEAKKSRRKSFSPCSLCIFFFRYRATRRATTQAPRTGASRRNINSRDDPQLLASQRRHPLPPPRGPSSFLSPSPADSNRNPKNSVQLPVPSLPQNISRICETQVRLGPYFSSSSLQDCFLCACDSSIRTQFRSNNRLSHGFEFIYRRSWWFPWAVIDDSPICGA